MRIDKRIQAYEPRKRNRELLDTALKLVKSLDYKPSARWVCYQLLQMGKLPNKGNAFTYFTIALSDARKGYWNGWTPETLSDSVRDLDDAGLGILTPEDFSDYLQRVKNVVPLYKLVEGEKYYTEVWFEARAMHGQFSEILGKRGIPLLPFGGDLSIPMKYETAMRLGERSREFKKPVRILYFGDHDKKGKQIPETAISEIRHWAKVEINFMHGGLTLEQAKKYNLPRNPEKPNEYQWEALSDRQAREIIDSTLKK